VVLFPNICFNFLLFLHVFFLCTFFLHAFFLLFLHVFFLLFLHFLHLQLQLHLHFDFFERFCWMALENPRNSFTTPSKLASVCEPVAELDFHRLVSWADMERDLSLTMLLRPTKFRLPWAIASANPFLSSAEFCSLLSAQKFFSPESKAAGFRPPRRLRPNQARGGVTLYPCRNVTPPFSP
jgi:hypothetical protein